MSAYGNSSDFAFAEGIFTTEPWQLVLSTILVIAFTALASAAGIGGGGLVVPVYTYVLGAGVYFASPISTATILGVALGKNVISIRRRHPRLVRPLINYDLATYIQMTVFLGTIVGVILHGILPEIIVTILLALVLGYSGTNALLKGVKKAKQEAAAREAATAAVDGNDEDDNDDQDPENGETARLSPRAGQNARVEESKGAAIELAVVHSWNDGDFQTSYDTSEASFSPPTPRKEPSEDCPSTEAAGKPKMKRPGVDDDRAAVEGTETNATTSVAVDPSVDPDNNNTEDEGGIAGTVAAGLVHVSVEVPGENTNEGLESKRGAYSGEFTKSVRGKSDDENRAEQPILDSTADAEPETVTSDQGPPVLAVTPSSQAKLRFNEKTPDDQATQEDFERFLLQFHRPEEVYATPVHTKQRSQKGRGKSAQCDDKADEAFSTPEKRRPIPSNLKPAAKTPLPLSETGSAETEIRRLVGSPGKQREMAIRAKVRDLFDRERRCFWWEDWTTLGVVTAFMLIYALIKSEIIFVWATCDTAWWIWYVLPAVIIPIVQYVFSLNLLKWQNKKIDSHYAFQKFEVQFTHSALRCVSLAGLGAGTIASLVGVGGGMVIGPLFLQLKMIPEESSATSGFMMVFTALSGTIQYLANSAIRWDFLIWFAVTGAVGGLLGELVVKEQLAKLGRPSVIILLLGSIILVATVTAVTSSIVNIATGNSSEMWHFDTEICPPSPPVPSSNATTLSQ